MDVNVLVRGQSNALLFADRGGATALEQGLEARLGGVDVHMLYRWDADASTIFSATAFMDWDAEGEQASLLRFVRGLPADIRDNPTATLWLHNEYDQKIDGLTTDAWVREVRADAALVRQALGQGADTTPYTFVPIRYPYGGNLEAIADGMAALDADSAFNASVSWAALSLAMNGGPEAGSNGAHMGDADAVKLGRDLAPGMAAALRPLVDGSLPAALLPAPDTLVLRVPPDAQQGGALHTVEVDGFQARYGALPDQGFVERLYLDTLGRPGEEEGIAHWTGALDAGALSKAGVAAGFASSPEMAAKLAPLAADNVFFV